MTVEGTILEHGDSTSNKLQALDKNSSQLISNINKLGSLMTEVSKIPDVDLEQYSSRNSLSCISHPNSLRATVLQINDTVYAAFSTAHVSMEQIRLHAINVHRCKESTKLTLEQTANQKSETSTEVGLPMQNRFLNSCMESTRLSRDVFNTFDDVIQLIEETLKVLSIVNATYQQNRKETAGTGQQLTTTEEETLTKLQQLKHKNEESRTIIQSAQFTMKKATSDIPVAWTITGRYVVETLRQTMVPVLLHPRQWVTNSVVTGYDYGMHLAESLRQIIVLFVLHPRQWVTKTVSKGFDYFNGAVGSGQSDQERQHVEWLHGLASDLSSVTQRDLNTNIAKLRAISLEAARWPALVETCREGIELLEFMQQKAVSEQVLERSVVNTKIEAFLHSTSIFKQNIDTNSNSKAMGFDFWGSVDKIFDAVSTRIEEAERRMMAERKNVAVRDKEIIDTRNLLQEIQAQKRRLATENPDLGTIVQLLRDGLENLRKFQNYWDQLSDYFESVISVKGSLMDELALVSPEWFHADENTLHHDSNFIANFAETYIRSSQNKILPFMSTLDRTLFDQSNLSE